MGGSYPKLPTSTKIRSPAIRSWYMLLSIDHSGAPGNGKMDKKRIRSHYLALTDKEEMSSQPLGQHVSASGGVQIARIKSGGFNQRRVRFAEELFGIHGIYVSIRLLIIFIEAC